MDKKMRFHLVFTEDKKIVRSGLFGMFKRTETNYNNLIVADDKIVELRALIPDLMTVAYGSAVLFTIAKAFALRAGSRFKLKGFTFRSDADRSNTEFVNATYIREIQKAEEDNNKKLMTREWKRTVAVLFEDRITGEVITLSDDWEAFIDYSDTASDELIKDFNNTFLQIWNESCDSDAWEAELDELFYMALEKSRLENERYHNSF